MEAFLNSNTPVWLLVMIGFASFIATMVGVYRKWKAGEIEDDGTLLDRVTSDNANLRTQLDLVNLKYEDERLMRRHAEDKAAVWHRQLREEGFIPKEVKKNG